jgi:hypothetical protein
VGKIVASNEASVSLMLATAKPKYATKPVLRHVETAQTLLKLKAAAAAAAEDQNKDEGMFVYGKEGSDIYKITL